MHIEPRIDLPGVTLWRFRELHEASMRAETVLPLGPLDREALVARIREPDDHVADRVEDPRSAHAPIISQQCGVGGTTYRIIPGLIMSRMAPIMGAHQAAMVVHMKIHGTATRMASTPTPRRITFAEVGHGSRTA